ncbi:MAG TPA: LysE family transporter [Ignavibacteria bacterium]|nr:LysE family transporter [Ignavibacteria bacterium]
MLIAFITGAVFGYLLSMPPMGPTNFAIMVKGFKHEMKEGVAIGVGAGFMDMIYILIAYGGISLLFSVLPESAFVFYNTNESLIKVILTYAGCAVVIIYGVKIMRMKLENPNFTPKQEQRAEKVLIQSENVAHRTEENLEKVFKNKVIKDEKSGLFTNFMTGVLLCLSSVTLPASWIAFVSYFKGLGIIDSHFMTGFLFGVGVLVGAVLWFYTLVKLISKNSYRIKPETISKINVSVGVLLIMLGIALLYKAVEFTIEL